MTRRLALHIGIHKTGTTTFQRFCAWHRAELRARGIDYPLEALGDGRVDFNGLGTALLADAEEAAGCWGRVLAAASQPLTLLSGEALCRLDDEQVAAVREWTRDFEVGVIVYLRNVEDYLVSAYKQRIKRGSFAGAFGAFISEHAAAVDYDALVRRWEGAFGADAVDVRVYDRVVRDSDVVTDLLASLGAEDLAPPVEPERANVSPDDRTVALVRAINRVKQTLAGRRRRSRLFRLLRESALRRALPWRLAERLFRGRLVTEADRAALAELRARLPRERLAARLDEDDLALLFSPGARPDR